MKWRFGVVARNEVKGYFDHPTAYMIGVAFLGLSLFLAFRSLYGSGLASLRPLFDWLPILYAVFIPAVTMRSLSEERRLGTLEWLSAQPLSETDIVIGKFWGCWLFVLAVLAWTIPTALSILAVSTADPGILVAEYAGSALLAGELVALGLWASSITRNQVTAFILAATISFTLYLIGSPIVQIGFPPSIAGGLAQLSVISHFSNIARGVIDLRDALYFVTLTTLFLVLAIAATTRSRLSTSGAEYKRLRLGVGVVSALVLVVNLLGNRWHGRLDLTKDNVYTLSDGTREMLSRLDDLVKVRLFASGELPPEVQLQLRDVRDLLEDMRRASKAKLVVTETDPDKDKSAGEEAASWGIRPIEFNVLRSNEFQVRRGVYGMAVLYADSRRVMPVIEQTGDLEFRLASAISGMTAKKKPRVAFVSGYGAMGPDQIRGLSETFTDRYDLAKVDLDSVASVPPDSVNVLVVAGPIRTMDSLAVDRVRSFIGAGGAALVLVDPVVFGQEAPTPIRVHSGLGPLLEEHGVRFNGNLVFDLASNQRLSLGRRGNANLVAPYPLWPVTVPAGVNPVTRSLKSLPLAWAGSLEIVDTVSVSAILQTTKDAGSRDPGLPVTPDQDWSAPPDQMGVRVVAVAIDPPTGATPRPGRMIVVSDASFLEGEMVQQNPQNLVFVANALDWLTQDELLIHIRSKDRSPPPLMLESDAIRDAMKWGNLAGAPLLFVVFGFVRIKGRRKRAERRWNRTIS